MPKERLQKILARAGVASRRAAERMIAEKRVRVNGRIVTELGTKADPQRDRIDVDNERIVAEKPAYYVIHKPREVVTTLRDPEGRETIHALVRTIPERVFPIGRLDYHTSGVLLLTNDGDLADALTRPKRGVPKTYAAKFSGHLIDKELQALRTGVVLDDGYRTRPADVFVLREEQRNTWVQITLTEGKNRQVHRMVEALGLRVMRLARMSFAGLTTEGMRPGQVRPLTGRELEALRKKWLKPARKARDEG